MPGAFALTDSDNYSRGVNLVVAVLMILGGIGQFWPSVSV
jgi:hypothetical protein